MLKSCDSHFYPYYLTKVTLFYLGFVSNFSPELSQWFLPSVTLNLCWKAVGDQYRAAATSASETDTALKPLSFMLLLHCNLYV